MCSGLRRNRGDGTRTRDTRLIRPPLVPAELLPDVNHLFGLKSAQPSFGPESFTLLFVTPHTPPL